MADAIADVGAAGAALATHSEELFQGQRCHRLTLTNGDSVLVAQHGAHVISWLHGGRERLFLSPNSVWDGRAAIRGGIPVCFPQFNQRGDLPKHGFVRNLPWALLAAEPGDAPSSLSFGLSANDSTRAMWPAEFEARLRVDLLPEQLCVTLEVRNLGTQALHFTGALHSYLAVSDIAQVRLTGLGGQKEWDSRADTHQRAADSLQFTGPFDRVYSASPAPMHLYDPLGGLEISNSEGWTDCVVWNPGAAGCAIMADMTPDAYQHMLCVEAAQVFDPISVAPGGHWSGSQRLCVLGL
ncbi:MAG: D-hexose-6-phosphate mutarotase [Rhodoferax sp.]|nr:D-hexose-6-phosphate mutarotase [Rhodoferax sp.]